MTDHPPGPVRWTTEAEMTAWVDAALADPRVGDRYHEMYSFFVEVTAVGPHAVAWRSSSGNTDVVTREQWAASFRYDTIPHARTMALIHRGGTPTGPGTTPSQRDPLGPVGQFVRDRYAIPDDQRDPDDPLTNPTGYIPCGREHPDHPKHICIREDGHP